MLCILTNYCEEKTSLLVHIFAYVFVILRFDGRREVQNYVLEKQMNDKCSACWFYSDSKNRYA
jgi:hypothetical protein